MRIVKCGAYYINLDQISEVELIPVGANVYFPGREEPVWLDDEEAKPLLDALERYVIVATS